MPRRLCPPLLSVVLLATLAGRAGAVAPQIKDEGKFFSPEVVKKADEAIRELYRKTRKDLLIETYATVPGDQAAKVKAMSPEEREKFFAGWARQRMLETAVRGVYILVTKEPPFLQIEFTRGGTGFTDQDYKELRAGLRQKFREKKFDEGLRDAVRFVGEKLNGRAESAP